MTTEHNGVLLEVREMLKDFSLGSNDWGGATPMVVRLDAFLADVPDVPDGGANMMFTKSPISGDTAKTSYIEGKYLMSAAKLIHQATQHNNREGE